MQIITTGIGQVKVGDTMLPGTFESLEISGGVQVDEVEIPGKKDRVTQAVGYENATLRLTLVLLPAEDGGDCTGQIRTIQSIFRQSPDQEKPGVYRLVNKHAQARGINEVIFRDFRTYEDNKNDKILVTCEFTEHVEITVQVAEKKTSSGTTTPPAAKKKPVSPTFGSLRQTELTKPSGMGAIRGLEIQDKLLATPAQDTRKPGLGLKILAWLKGEDRA